MYFHWQVLNTFSSISVLCATGPTGRSRRTLTIHVNPVGGSALGLRLSEHYFYVINWHINYHVLASLYDDDDDVKLQG